RGVKAGPEALHHCDDCDRNTGRDEEHRTREAVRIQAAIRSSRSQATRTIARARTPSNAVSGYAEAAYRPASFFCPSLFKSGLVGFGVKGPAPMALAPLKSETIRGNTLRCAALMV